MTRRREAEQDGGASQVAAFPREPRGVFGAAGGVGERAGSVRDVRAGGADGLLDPPVRAPLAGIGVGRAAAELLGAGDVRAVRRERGADRQGQRAARVIGRAGHGPAGPASVGGPHGQETA